MPACDTLVCIRGGTCLVKRHRINAEVWAKLDKIKHTGGCTDAGQCSECAALFMFSNMGFLMRVWWLFLELETGNQYEPRSGLWTKLLHLRGAESGIKARKVHQDSNLEFWLKCQISLTFVTALCLHQFLLCRIFLLHTHASMLSFYV